MSEMDTDKIFFVGQKAFIEKDGKVLVVFDPVLGLDFPGGKLKEDEPDPEASLRREVREETGLEIEIGQPFCVWTALIYSELKKRAKDLFLIGFKCTYKSGEVKISDEHTSFQWVDKDSYKKLAKGKTESFFQALEKYFERA